MRTGRMQIPSRDAFSRGVKEQAAELIEKDLGQVDMVVYSLASPRRTLADGTTVSSTLKTTDSDYTNKTIDLLRDAQDHRSDGTRWRQSRRSRTR